MEPKQNQPESRKPGLIGLGLMLVVGLGFGLGHWFRPASPEPERLSIPSAPSLFTAPAKLMVYHEGPALPQVWVDTFSSAPGFPKVELRPLSRSPEGRWPSDGDVYLIKARTFPEMGRNLLWMDLTGKVSSEGINPVYLAQAYDPAGKQSRPWRVSPWFFMKKVAPGTNPKVAMAPPARWWTEPAALFPNDPDLLGAIWIKSQNRSIRLGGEPFRNQATQQAEASLAGKTVMEEECWKALQDGQANFSFLPSWHLILNPQAGNGLIRWSALPTGTIVDFEVMAVSDGSTKKEMACKFLDFLLASSQQAALLGATGYFPVRSKPGKEWEGSSMAMPAGAWFDRSEFILWPYPQPVAPVASPVPVTETNALVPANGEGLQKE
jgi:hypothetical protein